ncbi:MAG: MmgE/PrpD family protein, partial [Alphaproteobacteria bacterium]|nr:MmgE/PrpD family protein [Alphaproteobacteria bacterium]
VVIKLQDGTTLVDEIAVADAHPAGARPFARENYVQKFETLAAYAASDGERSAFIDAAGRVADLAPEELVGLTPVADTIGLSSAVDGQGIFDA